MKPKKPELMKYPLFAEALKKKRLEQGLSRIQLGEATGIGKSTIQAWEEGNTAPRPAQCKALSEYFNFNFSELIFDF